MRPKNYSRPLPNRVSGLNSSMLIGRLRAQMGWQGSLNQHRNEGNPQKKQNT